MRIPDNRPQFGEVYKFRWNKKVVRTDDQESVEVANEYLRLVRKVRLDGTPNTPKLPDSKPGTAMKRERAGGDYCVVTNETQSDYDYYTSIQNELENGDYWDPYIRRLSIKFPVLMDSLVNKARLIDLDDLYTWLPDLRPKS